MGGRPLRRVSVTVPRRRAEQARAVMIELFPAGFEEVELGEELELAAYTDGSGDERLEQAFGGARASAVDDGWQDRWRRFHRPVRVGPLWVGPPWEQAPPDAIAVVIDPGRAFGTGAHATTRLCLSFLLQLERGSLLDAGCGSGVLAIAAARLGFAPVLALDNDPLAVEATLSNGARNGVQVEVALGDALEDRLPVTEIAVTNINLEVTGAVAARLASPYVVTSGYLVSEEPEPAAYEHVERRSADGWAADLYRRRQPHPA